MQDGESSNNDEKNGEGTVVGTVTEKLRGAMFRVEVPGEDSGPLIVTAMLGGRMKKHRIRVLIGDQVEMIMGQESPGVEKPKARIVRRL